MTPENEMIEAAKVFIAKAQALSDELSDKLNELMSTDEDNEEEIDDLEGRIEEISDAISQVEGII